MRPTAVLHLTVVSSGAIVNAEIGNTMDGDDERRANVYTRCRDELPQAESDSRA